MSRCNKDEVCEKGAGPASGALSLTGQMPSLGRAQQPSRQCATLGTTPERIEGKFVGNVHFMQRFDIKTSVTAADYR